MSLGIREPSEAELLKLYQKNLFVNVLAANEGQQIVVVGDTSTGKSTTINFLLGYPINFEARGIGTRRPCVISQVQDPGAEEVVYTVHFPKGKEGIFNEDFTEMEEVAQKVADANDAKNKPHYFECLIKNKDLDADKVFDSDPIYVTMRHKSFKYGLRLVDLPGLTRNDNGPMDIAKTYIQPGNICILVMGNENAANGGFKDLAERMCDCSQVMFIQNFAMNNMKSTNAEESHKEIKKLITAKAAAGKESAKNLLQDLKFYMTDYGYPCTPENQARGTWKAGTDQENWVNVANQRGCQAVQQAMYDHAEMWANKLRSQPECKWYFEPPLEFGAGVKDILEKIVKFQFDGIDAKLMDYRNRVEEMIEESIKEEGNLKDMVRTLENPPQWQNLLSKVALTVSEYLDTTIAIPDEDDKVPGEMRDIAKCRKTTKEEAKMRDECTEEEEREDEMLFGAKRNWIDETTDDKILKMLQNYLDPSPFEYEHKLACLKSWYRLLDELTGILAFLPMKHIAVSQKLHAVSVISGGMSASTNKMEVMVNLVCSLGTSNGTGVRDLVCHFVRRLKRLARRDIRNAMIMVREDRHNAIQEFLQLVGDTEQTGKEQLLKDIEKVIMLHMNAVFKSAILGRPKLDEYGRQALDTWGHGLVEPGSGICVISDREDAQRSGILHWLLPFKEHYFNGQIPFKSLRLGEELCNKEGIPYRVPPGFGAPQDVDQVLMQETCANGSLNASNVINMQIFKLCTENYDVEPKIDDPTYLYSLEVMKLLKAMQGEIACFWSNTHIGMLQALRKDTLIMAYAENKLKSDLKAAGCLIELQNLEEYGKPFLGKGMAMEAVAGYFNTYNYPEDLKMKTIDEITACEQWLPREVLQGLAGGDLSWPGIQTAVYGRFIQNAAGAAVGTGKQFPATAHVPATGDFALRRLCEEFIYVVLQLAMDPVTPVELSLAKASRGKQLMESPMEIVTKLVLHRLSKLGQNGGVIFKHRFSFIYQKVAKQGLDTWMAAQNAKLERHGMRGQEILPKITKQDGSVAIDGAKWVLETLQEYAASVLDDTLGQLANKFDELQPFDWTTLNGRLPFGNHPLRPEHYKINQSAGSYAAERVPTDQTKKNLSDLWTMPLRYQWPNLCTGSQFCLEEDKDVGGDKLKLDDATNFEAFQALQVGNAEIRINEAMQVNDNDPPAANCAGGAFHEMALRVHKSMIANAIDYCRPRIKTMMSEVYQEEKLRLALQGSPHLSYKERYAALGDGKQKELEDTRAKIKNLKETLDIIKSDKIHSGGNAELSDSAQASRNKRLLDAEQAKSAELASDLAVLEELENKNAKDMGDLEATNKVFAKTLKKYVALDQLSVWSLTMDKVTINKIPEEWKEDRFSISAFYFQQPWMGRDMKMTVSMPQKILPFQWLVRSGSLPWKQSLDFEVAQLYEDVATTGSLAGVKLPTAYPPGEHFLAIEFRRAWVSGNKGFFGGGKRTENVEVICTVVVPFAYALKDKKASWDLLEEAGSFGKLHSDDGQNAFRQVDRTPGAPNKTYMFKYEEALKHFGMTGDKCKGMDVEVTISQNKERHVSAAMPTGDVTAPPAPRTPSSKAPPTPAASAAPQFHPGQKVQYFSTSKNNWYPTNILQAFPDGTYEVDLKKGVHISVDLLKPM